MRRELVRARVCITLVPTGDGGRSRPLDPAPHYRPDHDFGRPDGHHAIGQIDFDGAEPVMPGESCEAIATFISAGDILEDLKEGSAWRVKEGARHVGDGRILEIQEIRNARR